MAKSDTVDTVLTGAETADEAFKALMAKYDRSTVVSMLNRGEYDVLYRQDRREVTSEKRKSDRVKMRLLEEELRKKDPALLDKLDQQVKATVAKGVTK